MSKTSMLDGAPTKRFFASMLPRDLDLDIAILGLVDNSVDGAMRQSVRPPGEEARDIGAGQSLEGYSCDLTLNAETFELKDNCGGIPDGYLDAAFKLGRPNAEMDGSVPTIGMYGIGMKRAIFKMARDARVVSRSAERTVEVHYSPE